ncbi:MAG: hypothetical protein WCW36_02730 [Candidatus Paceibacterota bacterium]|jgi:hypothetical protein
MFGLALVFISSIFGEAGASVGKREISLQKETVYSLGFLSLLWGTAFFFAYALATSSAFIFDFASLPFFLTRVVFEIGVAYCMVHAVALADRSTFGLLRILTLPFLILVDLALGYTLGSTQIVGISVIAVGLVILFMNHGIKRQGAYYVVCGALLAVITISLYKYDITHYNSVSAEQGVMGVVIMTFYYLMARIVLHENPFRLLRNPTIFIQSLVCGVGQVFLSFAYLFAPASVIATANRSFNALASLIAGDIYFNEKHILVKSIAFVIMAVGIILLAL